MSSPVINKLVVIGLGLIGGSLAKAARERQLCTEVIGVSRSQQVCDRALETAVADRAVTSLADIAGELAAGDVLVIAVPTLAVAKVMAEVSQIVSDQVTITDVASVKGSVVADATRIYGQLPSQFVPGHPIAGGENSGIEAVNSQLFENHKVILTPSDSTGEQHLQRIVQLWQGAGATTEQMSVAEHDEVLAATSHLPHMLAFLLVDTLAGMRDNREIFRYAAGGFRDFTRIAGSDPVMWHDIAQANRGALVSTIDHLMGNLAEMRQAIDAGDSEYLLGVFTRAREARNHFTKMLEMKAYMEPESDNNVIFTVQPGGAVNGTVRVPGDKSISHRSIMLGSLAEGVTEVTGFLEGEDSLATLQAFRDMGVVIEGPTNQGGGDGQGNGRVTIHGVGLHGLKQPAGPLYLGNSGTSMRLLSGLLAGQAFDTELTGDHSLSGRPMNRVAEPLRTMGARIETAENGRPPLRIKGGSHLKAIDYKLPMASAQVKSCVLLAGLYAQGETRTTEPAPTRDHTERMLSGFGYPVERDGASATVRSGGKISATTIDVPADISSATFFMVAAAIAPGSDITLQHVGINPTRIGVINILRLMGANIDLHNEREIGGEPVADIRVRYAPLKGIAIPEDQVPLAIDEFPALFVAAACAEGQTVLTGAEELRVKESDRIQAMADGLQILGVDAQPTADGMIINGGDSGCGKIGSGEVESCDDHRIAMAFAVAGLRATGPVRINNCNNVATSFPGFVELAQKTGIQVTEDRTR
ncbi:bifunctional prephenate dehydrogenase/3-phosphoshikimate 1-carboxyvinyltransferase [Porticoccus sp. W117]|uniref:bifunctional prephenate dehydrogenase/3-phosphoshikimate 1-carboxyvinyltransferase n=1 Tax=Porticoccus sp. W117 TaxID=3054777 RepID=UPI00259175E7|nr:bifunctional prephenate dehydrogenase/3-phosphoshikimate 1-carboxyvinyltransferase [Porticoccus sp. W117]MDM3872088.1 bifunctional prephenate dehydrogenase/3-phosphoshikimate 1-carboxyvinyltransferase [Porticoccus sp. W117]